MAPTTAPTPATTRIVECEPSICYIGWLNELPVELDFFDFLKYNIFTFGDFLNLGDNPSDVEGRVAVGGNHQVPIGHSIGEKSCSELYQEGVHLPPNYNGVTCQNMGDYCCPGYDTNILIVRESSIWLDGRLFFGGACIGNLNDSQLGQFITETAEEQCIFGICFTSPGLTPECVISDECVPNDVWWNQMVEKIKQVSATLYNLPTTGVTFWEAMPTLTSPNGGANYSSSPHLWTKHLWLQPLGNRSMHVFEIDASVLKQTESLYWAPEPLCAALFDQSNIGDCNNKYMPDMSDYIVINVKADTNEDCQISHLNMDILKPHVDHIIWNFGECKNNLKFQGDDGTGMGVYGMIIAPDATLYATGHIDGLVFVKEFIGTAQINWLQFECIKEQNIYQNV